MNYKTLEQKIHYFLLRYPSLKKIVKRIYQSINVTFSRKEPLINPVECIIKDKDHDYFFGYYDKSPWDITDRYLLCHRVNKGALPNTRADILLIDTQNNNCIQMIGDTHTWNYQQGSMLQWLGPDYSDEIIYNDYRDGRYCAVIYNIKHKTERIIPSNIYSVSPKGDFALSLNFVHLYHLRKSYGYYPYDTNQNNLCIRHIDLTNESIKEIISYSDLLEIRFKDSMRNAQHKVNHIMINPSGRRFLFMHRWIKNNQKYSRLFSCQCDGSDLYSFMDYDMISHYYWKNDQEIIVFLRHQGKNGYYLLKDKSTEIYAVWKDLHNDGHPSYSLDERRVITDTYPDKNRCSTLYLNNEKEVKIINRFYHPFRYDEDNRCDLHPRWNRKGDKICFDGVLEGNRAMYVMDVT